MPVQTILSISSALFGLAGSVVLAISLNQPLLTLRTHVVALDVTVSALVSDENVPVFVGLDEHHERSFRASTRRVWCGCGLIFFAFVAQLVAALLPVTH